jgi:peptidoglycan hydrolase-like protein with peptidoglycan-binding domain
MKSFRAAISLSLAAFLLTVPAFAHKAHHSDSATHKASSHGKTKSKKTSSHKLHGQQSIDSERVAQIQGALIREHYLNGEADGQWSSTTQAAMQKFQSDHGWQTKLIPDSRALVKLGLGPDYSTAINAKDVASAVPPTPPSTIPSAQAAGFAAAAGVNK